MWRKIHLNDLSSYVLKEKIRCQTIEIHGGQMCSSQRSNLKINEVKKCKRPIKLRIFNPRSNWYQSEAWRRKICQRLESIIHSHLVCFLIWTNEKIIRRTLLKIFIKWRWILQNASRYSEKGKGRISNWQNQKRIDGINYFGIDLKDMW